MIPLLKEMLQGTTKQVYRQFLNEALCNWKIFLQEHKQATEESTLAVSRKVNQ